jgi:surface antigen
MVAGRIMPIVKRLRTESAGLWAAAVLLAVAGCAPYAPVSNALTAGDRRLMEAITQQALERNRIGWSATWRSGRASGTVTPLRTFESPAGRLCREFQQTVTIDRQTEFIDGTACRDDDEGVWEIIRKSDPVGPGNYRRS